MLKGNGWLLENILQQYILQYIVGVQLGVCPCNRLVNHNCYGKINKLKVFFLNKVLKMIEMCSGDTQSLISHHRKNNLLRDDKKWFA